ncbi:MAG: homocysteine S-methyltransferase family protein [Firmicutes bacterium]|nr:homocysteine S-methyltransferase family protein [Bacillota bacterium]
MEFRELLKQKGPIILDGGMGTLLQARGISIDSSPELAAVDHPDWLEDIHRSYVDAGSQIIYTNTFGANREKLRRCGKSVAEVVSASLRAARRAAGDRALVALDIGPIGQLLEPIGTLGFDEAVDIFTEIVEAGPEADLIVIETMTDLQECRAALLAAKEHSDLPVLVSLSYEATGRTFLGCPPAAAALTLEGLGADVIGINCSLGPREMPDLVRELTQWTILPIAIKPNAGLPDPASGGYDITAEEFAVSLAALADLGVKLFGGCCGTNPEYISLLCAELAKREINDAPRRVPAAVCTATAVTPIDRVRVIGERLNPTGKKLMKEALRRGDMDYMLAQALAQTEAGADILDVNVGLPDIDEKAMMTQVIRSLQNVADAPLQIDSTDPAVIERALRLYCGKAIVNSVNGDDESLDAILPIVKKYGAAVIGLTLDKRGIPQSAEERVAIARRILERALSCGIRKEDVFIDCLTLTVSAEQAAAGQTLEALRRVKQELGLKTVLGVSNISFGLPARALINQNFLTLALAHGLDLPIINPNVPAMMAAVRSYHLLMNVDKDGRDFIAAYAADDGKSAGGAPQAAKGGAPAPGSAPASGGSGRSLAQLVEAGLQGEARTAAAALLEREEPMTIVDRILIPALDRVGADFEAGRVYLPQLIQSAGAAQAAFEAIRAHLAQNDGDAVNRGTVVLATVKGDIHDIGKNIVKVLLENYGYNVVDLGKDVAPEDIAAAAAKYQAPLVGLSALMTTTLKSMADTISLLRENGSDSRVVVGGAVLTADYAASIGADFYARDAKETVDVARQVVG